MVKYHNMEKTGQTSPGIPYFLGKENFLEKNKGIISNIVFLRTLELSEISLTLESLSSNCILSASFITYLSSTERHIRKLLTQRWKGIIAYSQPFAVHEFLYSERELLHWSSEGLPNDVFSQQNATILLNSCIPNLLLDPSGIASTWLQNHFKDENITVVTQHSSKFVNLLEVSVRFGKRLIVEVVDRVHPILVPLLRKDFVYQGPRKMINVGQKLLDYNDNFELLLTTRFSEWDSNSKLPVFCSVLNFGATTEALTQQILKCSLKVEKPLLEEKRAQLFEEEEKLRTNLYYLQEKLLKELADSQGDILQNKELLNSLNESKESSAAIRQSLNESVEIKKDMAKDFEVYQPLADYATRMFFSCESLSNINNMYHISVATFVKLFEQSISVSKDSESVTEKRRHLLSTVYNYVSRSLFKADRLAFALYLHHGIHPEIFQKNEWEVFTGMAISDTRSEEELKMDIDVPSWIDKERRTHIMIIKTQLPELYDKLKLDQEALWTDFIHNYSPTQPKHCNVSSFQFLIILKALRPDVIYPELVNFVLKGLSLQSLSPKSMQLNNLMTETSESEPVLIITTPGTDPTKELSALAVIYKMNHVKELVVGPGQEQEILNSLAEAAKNGTWLVLKNLHLLTSWLSTLEKEIQLTQPHHKDFRLWLITEPHPNFPQVLLSSSMKVTYEAPPGVKRNLERTYNEWVIHKNLDSRLIGSKTMFALAWFHAVIQERRTYIPQGWTSFYEFNETDLSVATVVIKEILDKSQNDDVQWDFIHGLFEMAVYGGRVNNLYDLRVISTYLKSFFNSNVMKKSGEPITLNFYVPHSTDIREHMRMIDSLPQNDLPELFGLPKNVARIWQRITSGQVIDQIKELNKTFPVGRGKGMKSYVTIVGPLIKTWKRLNQGQSFIYGKHPLVLDTDPIASFFALELSFAIYLITEIHKSLVELNKALKIGIFPNKVIADAANSLLQQRIPEAWDKIWSNSNNPKSYIENVLTRALRVKDLHRNWKSLDDNPFDFNDLFNVNKFIAALQQQAARFSKVPIDQLCLHSKWGSSTSKLEEGSVSIAGLLLEGAIMTNSMLIETSQESPSVTLTPVLEISWKTKKEGLNRNALSIPLYSNEKRETVIVELDVPCSEKDKKQWITGGVAFYIHS